jgi:hypothetical protein
MTALTAKQKVVIEAIQQLGKATAIDIAKVISGGQESADAHLRRLHNLKIIYVCEWGTGAYNHPIKVFAFGEGVDATVDKVAHFAKIRQARDALKSKPIKRYVYDKKAPIVPNTGWVSTIHTWDRSINNHDHVEYMARFQPRPDMAAEWLFNTPRSEI